MTKLVVPVAKVDDVDEGEYAAVTVAEGSINLAGGFYKIAAVATPITWKIGASVLLNTKGSYLAAGDQETIYVKPPVAPATTRPLRFIRAQDATVDGYINVCVAELYEVPGVDARPYETAT